MLWTVQKFTDNFIGCSTESIGVIVNINYDCIQSSNIHVGSLAYYLHSKLHLSIKTAPAGTA